MDLYQQRSKEMPQYRYKIKMLKEKNKGDDVEVKKATESKETDDVKEESTKRTKKDEESVK